MRWDQVIDALIAARKKAGVSVSALARSLQVTRGSIYNWEGLKNRPTIEQLQSWATAVGVALVIDIEADHVRAAEHALWDTFTSTADPGAVDAVRRLVESYVADFEMVEINE